MVVVAVLSGLMAGCGSDSSPSASSTTTLLYTSDAHYGIKRAPFSGMSSSQQVNGALVGVMNTIPTLAMPSDGGINSGKLVGAVDFVVETGDAVNRSEKTVYPFAKAPASAIWPQFTADYFTTLNVKDRSGNKAPIFMTPGNHDVSNAIGYYKAPQNVDAGLDATSYTAIYNLMMKPATPLTNASFSTYATAAASYASNRVVTSRDVNGVHFVFIGMWPDSITRPLIDNDLKNVPTTTPVVLFTHDQPDAESKHFTNPISPFSINSTNKFENLLSDTFADVTPNSTPYSDVAGSIAIPSIIEQQAFVTWLKTHKNIVAYFHGNDNKNEFYTYPTNDTASTGYLGTGYNINLNVFRVDSPMKGTVSGLDAPDGIGDPAKLSFQVVSIDSSAKNMTVREYLWNTKTWGASKTVSLAPRAL
jgi:predicted MPP superfamily phosphohydrolase